MIPHRVDKNSKSFKIKKNETRIDVYETLCPQQMLMHKGGQIAIDHWDGECRDVRPRDVRPRKLQVFNQTKKKWGVTVDVNQELK